MKRPGVNKKGKTIFSEISSKSPRNRLIERLDREIPYIEHRIEYYKRLLKMFKMYRRAVCRRKK